MSKVCSMTLVFTPVKMHSLIFFCVCRPHNTVLFLEILNQEVASQYVRLYVRDLFQFSKILKYYFRDALKFRFMHIHVHH